MAGEGGLKMEDHPHTGFVFERDGMAAKYLIDDIDSGGVSCRRAPIGEFGHEEYFTWNEFTRGIQNRTIRVYDYTDTEMGIVDEGTDKEYKEWEAYGPPPSRTFAIYAVVLIIVGLLRGWDVDVFFIGLFTGVILVYGVSVIDLVIYKWRHTDD